LNNLWGRIGRTGIPFSKKAAGPHSHKTYCGWERKLSI